MNIKSIYHKLFVGGKWYVGYRKVKDYNTSFTIVDTLPGTWIADPFLFEINGKHYLFVEQYYEDKKRAGLSVYEFINGEPIYLGPIIDNEYHMSYPCIFRYKNDFFIIPESSANGTIDLYRATDFPLKWIHDSVLLNGERYVDSTVFYKGDDILLLSYRKTGKSWTLVVFEVDIDKRKIIKLCQKDFPRNSGRPAGFLFNNGELYRPSQNCKQKYGESIIINKVTVLEKNRYEEEEDYEIEAKDIQSKRKYQRVHTINRDSEYEVVDFFEEKFDLFHAIKIFKRAYVK